MVNREGHALVASVVEGYNAKDIGRLESLYHPEASYWSPLTDLCEGRDEVIAHIRELFAALPDEQMRAEVVVAGGSTVVAEFESRGSPANGGEYRIRFTEVFELEDGLITAVKAYIDPAEVEAITDAH
tara:strand:- start:612 stop:995 length:384 start_codon:yes stop_codon:yes gene_type:complete